MQQAGGSQGSTGTSGKARSEKDHKRKKKSKGKPASSSNTKEPEQQRLAIVEEAKRNAPDPPAVSPATNPVSVPMDTAEQALPEGRVPVPCDSKALQMAALTHALSCIKKFRDQDLGTTHNIFVFFNSESWSPFLSLCYFIPDLNEESGDEISPDAIWTEQFEMMKDELNLTEQV